MEASTSAILIPWAASARLITSVSLGPGVFELLGHLQEEADVLDGRDLERGQDDDRVRRIHHRQRDGRSVPTAGRPPRSRGRSAGDRRSAACSAGVTRSAPSGRGWRSSTRMPVEWSITHGVDDVAVRLAPVDRLGDGAVLGIQVQEDADVAELEVGVDQARPGAGLALKRQPPGWWRWSSAGAALGEKTAMTWCSPRSAIHARGHRGRPAAVDHLLARDELALVDGADAGRELVGRERLDQELAGPGRDRALSCSASPWTLIMMIGEVGEPLRDDLGGLPPRPCRAC